MRKVNYKVASDMICETNPSYEPKFFCPDGSLAVGLLYKLHSYLRKQANITVTPLHSLLLYRSLLGLFSHPKNGRTKSCAGCVGQL